MSPISFWDAFKHVKQKLQQYNLYEKYEKSFLNELFTNAFYNLASLSPNTDAYNYLYSTIHYGTEIEFQISSHPASFYDTDLYKQYLDIINSPSTDELVDTAVKEALPPAIDAAVKAAVTEITSSKAHRIGLAVTKIPRTIKKSLNGGNQK